MMVDDGCEVGGVGNEEGNDIDGELTDADVFITIVLLLLLLVLLLLFLLLLSLLLIMLLILLALLEDFFFDKDDFLLFPFFPRSIKIKVKTK